MYTNSIVLIVSFSRPAWLGDTQLKMEVNVGNSTTASRSVWVYFRSMFQILVPGMFGPDFPVPAMVDTDNVTMLLRTDQVSSSVQDIDSNDTLRVRLQIGDELQESLNVSLNSLSLQSGGLQNCTPQANNSGEMISYIPLSVFVDNVLVPGEYRFAVVAEFSSANDTIESDLRDPNRLVNVTQVLRVDLGVLFSLSLSL